MIIQMLLIMIYGVWVDKSQMHHKPLLLSLVISGLGLGLFAFASHITAMLFAAQTLKRTGFMLYMGTVFPRVHQSLVDRQWPLLDAGIIHHMQVGFWEVITLCIMASFIAVFGIAALPYTLIACAVGSFISYKGMEKVKNTT